MENHDVCNFPENASARKGIRARSRQSVDPPRAVQAGATLLPAVGVRTANGRWRGARRGTPTAEPRPQNPDRGTPTAPPVLPRSPRAGPAPGGDPAGPPAGAEQRGTRPGGPGAAPTQAWRWLLDGGAWTPTPAAPGGQAAPRPASLFRPKGVRCWAEPRVVSSSADLWC